MFGSFLPGIDMIRKSAILSAEVYSGGPVSQGIPAGGWEKFIASRPTRKSTAHIYPTAAWVNTPRAAQAE